MNKKLLCSVFLLSTIAFNVSASEKEYIEYTFYADYIKKPHAERYDYLVSLIEENETNRIKITEGDSSFYMPLNAFLVLQDHTTHALNLIRDGYAQAFETFEFDENQTPSDVVFAIDMGKDDYVNKVIGYIDDVNKRFTYNGERGYTLLMVAANNNRQETYSITQDLLTAGANQYSLSYNNLNALSIAQDRRNNYFINSLTAYNEMVANNGEGDLLKNSPRSGRLRLEDNRIIENLNNYMLEDILSMDNPHEDVFRLTIQGYTQSAKKLIDAMVERDVFDPNYRDESGFSLLMASSLSSIIGGDVEVAQKLISLGADVDGTTLEGHTEGEVAALKDAFKVLFLLTLNGFDPFSDDATSRNVDLLTLITATESIPVQSLNMLIMIYESMLED